MNLPNKLTIFRMILIIPFVIIELTGCLGDYSGLTALIIFVVASLTDLLDGKIARKYNLITNFGKFMDPLADKVLVVSAMICLLVNKPELLPAWALIIILAREFIISGFRLVASDAGIVIAASMWGKVKTVSQMVMVIMMLIDINNPVYILLTKIVMYVAVILTVVSLVDYIYKNKEVLGD
ncbi:MAG: CDP-diacylglycerol--glycerol-3-phosphate 3-phosphatidyltransferase [Lachnospiraceae bacterium]|nr:CDP-diacylglycerol--glycerol-3-phosphate 3-phosphatidyltransferase [Lachnospiraceae bacterium]